jgi:uncharacterized membrane protein YeaQ/YmgE (transglycosylase-associated protein family)
MVLGEAGKTGVAHIVLHPSGGTLLAFILVMLLIGLVAGFVARAVVPGDDSMSIGATIVLGIVGSFVGGLILDALFRNDAEDAGFGPAGLIGSILGAIVVLLVYNAVTRRGVGGRRGALR